jgi:hypothetical protein
VVLVDADPTTVVAIAAVSPLVRDPAARIGANDEVVWVPWATTTLESLRSWHV